jgi:broad specificity phosphatase PhoE
MEIVLVRHGEPEWSRDGLTVDDPRLTDRGVRQAELLAERLAGEHFDQLLVSPLRRARETMAPIAEQLRIEPTVADWLAEIRNPQWEGTPAQNVERIFAETRVRPAEEHWEGLPGGESFRDFHVRVTTGLDQLLDTHDSRRLPGDPLLWDLGQPDRRVLVVAHGGTNAVSVGHLLGIPPVPWEWERFINFHTGVSTVTPVEISTAYSYSLRRLSDLSHLGDDAALTTA